MNDLVVLKIFFHKYEAEIVKGLLESNGIKTLISSDDLGGFREHLTIGMGNIKVLVSSKNLEEAKKIINSN